MEMEGGAREQPTSEPWGRKSTVETVEGGASGVCLGGTKGTYNRGGAVRAGDLG